MPAPVEYVQCSLETYKKRLVCWLEAKPNLKKGVKVTLKDSEDPALLWTVVSIGDVRKEKTDIPRHGVFFESDL